MKWFFPSWNGDFRLEADGDACRLEIVSATESEKLSIAAFMAVAIKKGWADDGSVPNYDSDTYRTSSRLIVPLKASIGGAGRELVKLLKPMDRTITGVKFENGRVEVIDAASVPSPKDPKTGLLAKAAASIARATPSCPQCVVGAVDRASEVLLTFLNEEEHEDWAKERAIVVTGGLSGHRYLLAHRHSKTAARIGRICYDLDDRCVIHFHDNAVPPEEEVLGAKLILEHREPWLRNEATHFGATDIRFKNPFGDFYDGVPDAGMMQGLGKLFAAMRRP